MLDWRRIDLNNLKVLHALMLERHVGRAADRLGVTASSISHRLRRMREDFADDLFVRTPSGMVPSPRMEEIAVPLSEMIASITLAVSSGALEALPQARRFTLVVPDGLRQQLLPVLIQSLVQDHAGHSLEIRVFERRSYATELSQGEVDAVISVGGDRDDRSLVERIPVACDRLVCLFGPLCPLAGADEVAVDDYLSAAHLYSLPWPASDNHFDRLLARDGRSRRIMLTMPSHLGIGDALIASRLVATVPSSLARHLTALHPPLAIRPLAIDGTEGTVFLEASRQQQRRPEIARFKALVETAIRTVLPRSPAAPGV
ncbi:HTH-type transcriptional regulator YidZ [Ensifer adhaerens]|uniref:LysR family transcriptional regulator n=1 Tax=Ensifer adhaerens TaxID=106592 RepID=UPI001569F344|nr:LysR family transcriptional regulator [Ensifer adhaerens]NRP19874.1 HTH-type transcriptional regulator YidZ [Ensifer adhaerens]